MTRSGTWRTWIGIMAGCLLVSAFGCGNADRHEPRSEPKAPATSKTSRADSTTPNAASLTDTDQAVANAVEAKNKTSKPSRSAAPAPDSEPITAPSLKHLADIPPRDESKHTQPSNAPKDEKADAAGAAARPTVPTSVEQPATPSDASITKEKKAESAARIASTKPAHEPPVDNAVTPPKHGAAAAASEAAVDAIGEEPLFAGWPKPQVALVITGRQHGYLEPCGCAGLDRQKGGLIRRYTMIKQLRAKGWTVVPIDAGNQVRRFGRQPEIKYQMTIEGLKMMAYQVITFGPDDLRLSAPDLFAILSSSPETFVTANVSILDPSATSRYRVIAAGGKKIGVTAVLGAHNQKRISGDEVTMEDAKQALLKVWPQLEQQHCDLNVLICHGTIDESTALGKQFPGFQIVITTGGAGEPRREPELIQGTKTMLIEVGTKGMFAGVIGLFADGATPLRYQRVPLDARFHDSPEMLQLLAAYQDQLKAAGLSGLGIRPQPHPSGMKFIGSDSCEDCHPKAYKIWKKGRPSFPPQHSKAYQTLLAPPKRANVPRNFDPECISCHVVGWNPQQYYPYESGYLSLKETPKLINVGCEDCHGPGASHVAAENGDVDASDEELEQLRKTMKLPLKNAEQKCLECHDLDNSPDFQAKGAFEKYWEKIKH